jgi:hypothetical protein
VCLTVVGGRPAFEDAHHALDDPAIGQMIGAWCAHEEVVVGIDAPLSYAVGGGDRPADRDLRRVVIAAGMRPGPVMPPTLTRMAYQPRCRRTGHTHPRLLQLRGPLWRQSHRPIALTWEVRCTLRHPMHYAASGAHSWHHGTLFTVTTVSGLGERSDAHAMVC